MHFQVGKRILFMPYKDPERKRQWEREHREQRNARRRIAYRASEPGERQRLGPIPAKRPPEETAIVVGLIVAVASVLVVLFVVWNLAGRKVEGSAEGSKWGPRVINDDAGGDTCKHHTSFWFACDTRTQN